MQLLYFSLGFTGSNIVCDNLFCSNNKNENMIEIENLDLSQGRMYLTNFI